MKHKSFLKNINHLHFSTKNILLMRFIVANLTVVLFSVIILASISINKTFDIMTVNTADFSQNQIHITSNNLDSSISEVFRLLQSTVSTDPYIQNSMFSFGKWSIADKHTLKFYEWLSSFRSYVSTYVFINSVLVYNNSVVIDSASGIQLPDEYDKWKYITETLSAAKLNYTGYSPYISEVRSIKSSPVISFAMPLNANDSSFNSGIIIFNVNLGYFSQTLGYNQLNPNYISLIYDHEEDAIVTSSATKYNNRSFIDAVHAHIKNPSKDVVKIENGAYTLYSKQSDIVPKWSFYTFYNNNMVIKQKRSILIWYILIMLILIVICSASTWFITVYIYRPLQRIIANLNAGIHNIPNTQFGKRIDETEVISAHIETLRNELSEKNRFISDNVSKIRRLALINLLDRHSDISAADAQSDLAKCGIIFMQKYFYTVNFTVDRYLEILSGENAKDSAALMNKIYNTIYNTLSQTLNSTGAHLEHNSYVFILNTDKPLAPPDCIHIHQKINNALADVCSFTVSMCISESTVSMDELPSLYEQVLSLRKDRFVIGNEAVIICPYNKFYTNTNAHNNTKHISNIIHSLTQNDASQTLLEIEKFLGTLQNSDPEYIYKNIILLFDTIERTLKANMQYYDFNIVYKQLDNLFTYSIYSELYDYLISKLMEIGAGCKNTGSGNIAGRIKEYIDLYYYNDLSLDSLSETFKVSPSYISKTFVASYNIGFQNYLSEVRIEKAKDLLKNTNMNIQIISEKIGFANYNSFSRTFKRYAGVSAKAYRTNPNQANGQRHEKTNISGT